MDLVQRDEPIRAGSYYRRTANDSGEDESIPIGTVVMVMSSTPFKVSFSVICEDGDSTFECSVQDFRSDYIFDPKGSEERKKQVSSLIDEIEQMGQAQEEVFAELKELSSVDVTAPASANALVKVDPDKLIEDLNSARHKIAQFKKSLSNKQRQLSAMLKQKENFLAEREKEFSEMIDRIREVCWAISVYLGRNSQVELILKGQPAGPEEKIKIRQLILNMDEECAAMALKGGMDCRTIKEFDEWLKVPKHLNQILPENRGIVGMRIRKTEKEYGDPILNAQLNLENNACCLVIRNGENVWRVWSDINFGYNLYPMKKEFEDLFTEEQYNGQTGKHERTAIRPGSHKWEELSKKEGTSKRHYYRVLLLIQGLLDRTKIFHPLTGEGKRVNICDRKESSEIVEFIADAESETILSDGRKRFEEWLREVNAQTEVGSRIVGEFNNYNINDNEERRTSGRWGTPDSRVIYTIDKVISDGFLIRFARDKYMKNRTGYELRKDDLFWVNFDAVSVEDLRYYLGCRLDRKNYTDMFPLFHILIKLKEEEEKKEAPFRNLLANEISKKFGTPQKEAQESALELSRWWKFKNKFHRALTCDDQKAFRMIVKEFDLRSRKKDQLSGLNPEKALAEITKGRKKDVVFVGHKGNNQFVALIAHYLNENVFVTEETWVQKRNEVFERIDLQEWKTIDKRRHGWNAIYKNERYDNWAFDVSPREFLNGPEREAAVEFILSNGDTSLEAWGYKNKKFESVELCVVYDLKKKQLTRMTGVYFKNASKAKFVGNVENRSMEPHYFQFTCGWTRPRSGIDFGYVNRSLCCVTSMGYHAEFKLADHVMAKENEIVVLRYSQEGVDLFKRVCDEYNKLSSYVSAISNQSWEMVEPLRDAIKEKEVEKFKATLREEYGTDEDWKEVHENMSYYKRPDLSGDQSILHAAEEAANFIVNAKETVTTVRELVQRAKELGWKPVKKEDFDQEKKLEPFGDVVLSLPALKGPDSE